MTESSVDLGELDQQITDQCWKKNLYQHTQSALSSTCATRLYRSTAYCIVFVHYFHLNCFYLCIQQRQHQNETHQKIHPLFVLQHPLCLRLSLSVCLSFNVSTRSPGRVPQIENPMRNCFVHSTSYQLVPLLSVVPRSALARSLAYPFLEWQLSNVGKCRQ